MSLTFLKVTLGIRLAYEEKMFSSRVVFWEDFVITFLTAVAGRTGSVAMASLCKHAFAKLCSEAPGLRSGATLLILPPESGLIQDCPPRPAPGVDSRFPD